MRARWIMVGVVLVAAFFRLWQLSATPPGLHYDEAFNGIDAIDIWANGPRIFLDGNTGREPLFNHILALSVAVLGRNSYALRIPAALFGILTVAATYPMARSLFAFLGPA